jgi:hypothetical protein
MDGLGSKCEFPAPKQIGRSSGELGAKQHPVGSHKITASTGNRACIHILPFITNSGLLY